MGNKKHISFWIEEDDLKELDANIKMASARSRSEYVANAVKFYNGYMHDKNNEEYINSKVINSLDKMMASLENRMARQLFKQSVEICKVFWLIVKGFHLEPEDVEEFHEDCIKEVKRLNGAIELKPSKRKNDEERYR